MFKPAQRPALRILSDSLGKLNHKHGTISYNGREVRYVEIAGVCIEAERKFMKALDFCGEVPMTHEVQCIRLGHPYIFLCRPYFKDGVVRLHCKAIKKVDIFEEIFFWAEAINLREALESQDQSMLSH